MTKTPTGRPTAVAGVTTTRPPRPSGQLPFTGAPLLAVVLAGLGLAGGGLLIRKRSV